MPLLIALFALLALAGPSAAQCCGDCDDSGEVTINELIRAVNNSLNGCPAATPTPEPEPCPVDFEDDNIDPSTPACFYIGRWNANCGADDLEVLWTSDGEFIVVEFLGGFDPPLFYGAEVDSPTTGSLIGWFEDEDATEITEAPGEIALEAGGATLIIDPDSVPFRIDRCNFTNYDGRLIEIVGGTALRRTLPAPRHARALQRLHALRKPTPFLRNLERK
ncbi:MAG: hypothetical protein ACRERC_01210 [Candidatus Binatia bacterium]